LEDTVIKIAVTSVMVEDQARALAFYSDVLGFVKKTDIPMGEFRWLTVVSPAAPDGVELLLEPAHHPASKVFQKAMFDDGIPLTSFAVDNVQAEFERLSSQGVVFRTKPTAAGPVTIAVLEDTCGNLIQLAGQ
jgi:catechol 2,3-dioxygenase-like lactoylglutathione lyase family enzyme